MKFICHINKLAILFSFISSFFLSPFSAAHTSLDTPSVYECRDALEHPTPIDFSFWLKRLKTNPTSIAYGLEDFYHLFADIEMRLRLPYRNTNAQWYRTHLEQKIRFAYQSAQKIDALIKARQTSVMSLSPEQFKELTAFANNLARFGQKLEAHEDALGNLNSTLNNLLHLEWVSSITTLVRWFLPLPPQTNRRGNIVNGDPHRLILPDKATSNANVWLFVVTTKDEHMIEEKAKAWLSERSRINANVKHLGGKLISKIVFVLPKGIHQPEKKGALNDSALIFLTL